MSEEWARQAPKWLRALEVFLGLGSVVIAVDVLANLAFQTTELVLLLSVALLFSAVRMVAAGGVRHGLKMFEAVGLVGGGILAGALVLLVIFVPGLSFETLVYLLAIILTVQGLGRVFHSMKKGRPRWLRGSALVTGVLTLALAVGAVIVPEIAAPTLIVLLGAIVLLTGIEMVVWGLRPTEYRQVMLLKLILFSAAYGLVLINWVDLYGTAAPAYHIWLILTYMAPFGVLIVFQGFKDWQLAVSLGLLVSLMNDVGYFFIGDLLFGFHRALVPWIEGQLGFMGTNVLFYFQGGAFTIPVTSILMGATIYARIAVVSLVLYHWWKHPSKLDSRA
jgi:uncharacterized membrane protein HdeD (DUF308 family)